MEKLTIEKIKNNFSLINSAYHSEIRYDDKQNFFDLYFSLYQNQLAENQLKTYNELLEKMNTHLDYVENFMKSSYTKYEKKNENRINAKKLNIEVVTITQKNARFDAVIICSKQYKKIGIFKKNIVVRVELKNNVITSISRKNDNLIDVICGVSDTLKEN